MTVLKADLLLLNYLHIVNINKLSKKRTKKISKIMYCILIMRELLVLH